MAAEVAKVYANALFELYLESGDDDSIYKNLNEIAGVFRDHPDLVSLLSAPLITSEEKISVVSKIFEDNGLVYDYLCLLCDKGRAGYFTEITDVFNAKYNEYKNIADVLVITSIPLTETLREKLVKKLEGSLKKTILLTEKTDPSIIDGMIIEYDNKRIDNSVRSKLEELRRNTVEMRM